MFPVLVLAVLLGISNVAVYGQTPGSITNTPGVGAAINEPRPPYPEFARKHGFGGSGVFVLHVDVNTGRVRHVEIEQSTGVPLLDRSAVTTFERWKFRPHTVADKVRIPITFTPPQTKK
jgi:TonB family protein